MARYEVEVTRSITVEVDAPNEAAARAVARDRASDYPMHQWVHVDETVPAWDRDPDGR